MIPFVQSKVVVTKSNGERVVNGNCYPTAVACLIGIPPTDVPNIETLWDVDLSFAYEVMDRWLKNKGLRMNYGAMHYSVFHEGSEKIRNTNNEYYLTQLSDDQKEKLKEELKEHYYLVSGKSKRGVSHVCIYRAGILQHDPHPTGEGIETEEIFEVIEKIDT